MVDYPQQSEVNLAGRSINHAIEIVILKVIVQET